MAEWNSPQGFPCRVNMWPRFKGDSDSHGKSQRIIYFKAASLNSRDLNLNPHSPTPEDVGGDQQNHVLGRAEQSTGQSSLVVLDCAAAARWASGQWGQSVVTQHLTTA